MGRLQAQAGTLMALPKHRTKDHAEVPEKDECRKTWGGMREKTKNIEVQVPLFLLTTRPANEQSNGPGAFGSLRGQRASQSERPCQFSGPSAPRAWRKMWSHILPMLASCRKGLLDRSCSMQITLCMRWPGVRLTKSRAHSLRCKSLLPGSPSWLLMDFWCPSKGARRNGDGHLWWCHWMSRAVVCGAMAAGHGHVRHLI